MTRQANGEVADIDHFLHFAQTFLGDLARLPGHQLAKVGLVLAQQFAELPYQLATPRRGHLAPGLEGALGAADLLLDLGRPLPVDGADTAAVDRRMHKLLALLIQRRVDTQTIEQCGNHG